MLYNLNSNLDKDRFLRRVNQLVANGGVVELSTRRQRTLSQNNYLHLILSYFANETGYNMVEVKDGLFKKYINPQIFCATRHLENVGQIEVLRSTRELTTKELSEAIDNFRRWSAETLDIYLPQANEYDYLQQIEIDIAKSKRYE